MMGEGFGQILMQLGFGSVQPYRELAISCSLFKSVFCTSERTLCIPMIRFRTIGDALLTRFHAAWLFVSLVVSLSISDSFGKLFFWSSFPKIPGWLLDLVGFRSEAFCIVVVLS